VPQRNRHQRRCADERRLGAAEGRGDDDDIPLQRKGGECPRNREEDQHQHARLGLERRPDHVRRPGADAGAEQRHACEIGHQQDQRPDHAAGNPGQDHPQRLLGAHERARHQRAEDEAVDGQDDAEDAITGKARQQAAEEEHDGGRRLKRGWQHRRELYPSLLRRYHATCGIRAPRPSYR